MTFLKLLLSSGLIFMATMAQPSENENSNNSDVLPWDYIDHRLLSAVIPRHYNIMLKPFFDIYGYLYEGGTNQKIIEVLEKYSLTDTKTHKQGETDYQIYFYGQSNITIHIFNKTRKLILHSLNLHIDEEATILLNTSNNSVYKPVKHLYDNDIVTLDFKGELHAGYYILKMTFVGVIANNTNIGFMIISYKNMEDNDFLAVTHFQPIGARRVFPCWDEPLIKTTFNISLKHTLYNTALSNMPEVATKRIDEGHIVQTFFETTRSIPTYLIAIMLVNMTGNTNPIGSKMKIGETWYSRMPMLKLSYVKSIANNVIYFLHEHWKTYIHFSKLNYVVVPDAQTEPVFLNNIMGTWGMIVYRESDIIGNASDSVMKVRIQRLIAYKMIRQIIGNLISPTWWSNIWLNDALAQFIGINTISQIYPTHRVMDLFVVQDLQESFRLDYEHIMMSLAVEVRNSSEIESLFSSTRYAFTLRYKAPVLIYMLQHMVTNKLLRSGINEYLNKYSFSSATPDEFWNAMQAVLDESNQGSKYKNIKLKHIMKSWINKLGYPIVNVTLNSYGHTVIGIKHPSSVLGIQDMWTIPFTYTTKTDLNSNNTLPELWIDHMHLLSIHDEADWVIVNLQQAGYYRVNYHSDNWWKLVNFLHSKEYTKIHILNRAQIIDDAYHFLTLGELELPIFLELTKYLSHETDYVAWHPMFRIFESISNIIPLVKKWNILIKVHMRSIVHGLLNKIGYKEQSDEDDLSKSLRKEAKKWAYIFGDSEYLTHAHMELKSRLKNYEQITRSPVPKCQAWISLLTQDTSLLKSMDPDIVLNYIKFLIPDNVHFINQKENILLQDKRTRQRYIIKILNVIIKYMRNKRVLKYLLDNFHHLELLGNYLGREEKIKILIIIINHVYDTTRLNMISKMFMELLPNEKITWMFKNKVMKLVSNYMTLISNNKHFRYSLD